MPSPYNAFNPGPWKHTATGRKWKTHTSGRFFSGGFDFDTFGEAVAYARQQRENDLRYIGRHYPGQRSFYRATITGPGGELPWDVIEPLIAA